MRIWTSHASMRAGMHAPARLKVRVLPLGLGRLGVDVPAWSDQRMSAWACLRRSDQADAGMDEPVARRTDAGGQPALRARMRTSDWSRSATARGLGATDLMAGSSALQEDRARRATLETSLASRARRQGNLSGSRAAVDECTSSAAQGALGHFGSSGGERRRNEDATDFKFSSTAAGCAAWAILSSCRVNTSWGPANSGLPMRVVVAGWIVRGESSSDGRQARSQLVVCAKALACASPSGSHARSRMGSSLPLAPPPSARVSRAQGERGTHRSSR